MDRPIGWRVTIRSRMEYEDSESFVVMSRFLRDHAGMVRILLEQEPDPPSS